jgi:type IV secretory pathway TrbF-like protein
VALRLWPEQIGAQRQHYAKTFSLTRAGFLLKAKRVSGILWIDAAAVRHHAESALSFSHRQA